ncbi:hypothetical protein BV25DRAFT_462500 [Artomyces pyxidatus]|uniref:Uncharacterized protein n=1 Tax=Artomyces pyxidatus TaxID=48021 RepID=A0ACB8T527_9AGAM|nr:hypothetical protein BV25DRAFT_462500 [Artomyces pyxidatus]
MLSAPQGAEVHVGSMCHVAPEAPRPCWYSKWMLDKHGGDGAYHHPRKIRSCGPWTDQRHRVSWHGGHLGSPCSSIAREADRSSAGDACLLLDGRFNGGDNPQHMLRRTVVGRASGRTCLGSDAGCRGGGEKEGVGARSKANRQIQEEQADKNKTQKTAPRQGQIMVVLDKSELLPRSDGPLGLLTDSRRVRLFRPLQFDDSKPVTSCSLCAALGCTTTR